MTLFSMTLGLNREGQEEIVSKARQTHIGMAHFGGTGPANTTCRECKFWASQNRWYAPMGKHGGAPMPAPCRKYRMLMRSSGPAVPHDAVSCKFFDQADTPQPLQRPKSVWEKD